MKRKIIRKVIGLICVMSILSIALFSALPFKAAADNSVIIEDSDIPLRLHYDEPATASTEDAAWVNWSLPVGNGYFGANVFGRTETERIQITEKTLSNPYYRKGPDGKTYSLGGLNNFSETYVDIGHPFASVSNYERYLDLKTAISGVKYDYNGVTYTREVFTSYPDKALVIRLDASEAGKLSFVLRPTVPYEQEYAAWEGDGASKTGTVVSYMDGSDGIVELSGKMGYYDIDFLGMYRVVTNGGTVAATSSVNANGETDGTITVSGATSAYIYVTLGSDYELSSELFTTSDNKKPTFNTTIEDTRKKVGGEFNAIASQLAGKSFEDAYAVLKNNHLADYGELFGRVSLNLGSLEDAAVSTDELLAKYKTGDYSPYLETLYFQYGRYLLISSSRSGALPANLQGTWNVYNKSPWGSGIWHNINVQMNYWPAFSTNIAECFEAYAEYNAAYMPAAEANATSIVSRYNPSELNKDGGNGWSVGIGFFPYSIAGDRSPGNLGFTTQLFWEYYQYTQDKELLEEVIFPVLVSAARYIVKIVEIDEDGNYLVSDSDSPEMYVNGVWYRTKGTTYAQSFAYQNNYNALLAAKELGIDLSDSDAISTEELCVFKRVMEQLDKYDPIIVGLSGQVKEFREEDYYCSVGDDPHHRHISQLVGLYPGNIINSSTPAWLDAAIVTLTERGDAGTGWSKAHKINLWARTKNGDKTYQLLNTLLSTSTLTNLWDTCPPFQIDGNFGGTAGISEMLLQSHEGYIAPLAAISAAWESGSYTGLVARGNFEVSADWEDGVATTFNIKSKVGGEAFVSYGGITSAMVVRASDGKSVNYTVLDTDLISFETEVGETYIISGFKISEKLPAPASLKVSRPGLGEINLTWDSVAGAAEYRVYAAIESQPDYTLIGVTKDTSAVYIPSSENINARTTFKVIPANADGVEGKGAIAYQNPIEINAELIDYEANAFDSGELQVTLKASENTLKYKLWKRAAGESEYALISESPYPIIVYEKYSESDEYAVSLISNALRTESELYELKEIKKATKGTDDNAAVWYTNILEGKTFVPNTNATAVFSSSYGYDKLTDGIYDKDSTGTKNVHLGRFATKGVSVACLDGTVTFENTYLLSEMRIYDFVGANQTRIGTEIKVYALSNGEWREVTCISGQQNVIAAKKLDVSKSLYYVSIDLGVTCEALRVCATDSSSTQGVTLYEITCSGAPVVDDEANDVTAADTTSKTLYDEKKDAAIGTGNGSSYSLELDLGGTYALYELNIRDKREEGDLVNGVAATRSNDTYIELYMDGEWIRVLSRASLNVSEETTSFKLYGLKASKIRIGFNNTQTFDNGKSPAVQISEICCSVGTGAADKKPLLNAYSALPILNDGDATYISNMHKFKSYVTEFASIDSDVIAYTKEMSDYNATLLEGTHTAHNIKSYEGKACSCTEIGYYAYEACTLCDYTTYESILPSHNEFENQSFDDSQHWTECKDCEEKLKLSEHNFDSTCDEACSECDYTRAASNHTFDNACDEACNECGHTRVAPHSYTVRDTSNRAHWMKCECGAIDESTREEHSGGMATCSEYKICAVCNRIYGLFDSTNHTASEGWSADSTHHWKECTECGEQFDKAEHSYTANSDTCACGHTVSDTNGNESSQTPVGRIVAIVLGSIAAIGGLISGVVFFIMKRKKLIKP